MLVRRIKLQALLLAAIMVSPGASGAGLSDQFTISSQYMGYDLQYRVYTPRGVEAGSMYPVLLVSDGQWYIEQGGIVQVLDELFDSGRIKPVFVVFVDSRNPDDLTENRRNEQFMCNPDYVNFHTAELLPSLYAAYPINVDREETGILGVSFGGLNAACFGLLASNRFHRIGMHSPASAKHLRLVSGLYQKQDTLPLRVFMSSGTVNDNLRAARRFRDVLERQGNDVTYVKNKGRAHNWENWRDLLDDALLALFASNAPGMTPK